MEAAHIEILLQRWNPHFQNPNKGLWVGTVPREKYLSRLWQMMNLRHILILTGVRRSGKSTLMQQMVGRLLSEGVHPNNLLFLYFDDLLVRPYLQNGADLLEQIYIFYRERFNPQGRVYLFLDELQGVRDFNHWLASYYERREDVKFIVSGSRRSLMQSETATVLTGRNIQFDIYPFNFYEYLLVKNFDFQDADTLEEIRRANFDQTSAILHHLGNFFYEGGFPEIVLTESQEAKAAIASNYYRDVLSRDITAARTIRNARDVEVLGLQVLVDFTKQHTYRSLGRPLHLSVDTVKAYLEYFFDAFLFFESQFFSYKTKETQDAQKPRKLYVVDNGLRNFNVINVRPDLGQCAENAVFMELKKSSAAIHYWKGKREIDFAVLNPELKLYNVSYTDTPPERELDGMLEGLAEFGLKRGVVLTKNYFDTRKVEGKYVECVPLWAWLILNGKSFFKG